MADTEPEFVKGPLKGLSLKRLQELCLGVKAWLYHRNMTSSASTNTKADCIALIEMTRETYLDEQRRNAATRAERETQTVKRAEEARARRSATPPHPEAQRGFTGATASECNAWLSTLPPVPLAGEAE